MLFRREVFDSRRSKLVGNVILVQPISVYFISLSTSIIIIAIIFFLANSEYSRKEKVKGYLIPKEGLITVYSDREGVLENIFVNESEHVVTGQPLIKIKNSQSLTTGIEISHVLSKEIVKQLSMLQVELETNESIFKKERERLKRQIPQLKQSIISIKKVSETNLKRLEIKKEQYLKNLKLLKSNYISKSQLISIQEEYFETMENNDKLEKEIAISEMNLINLESEIDTLPGRELAKKNLLERQISELKIKQYELENQYEFIKVAPESGIVTTIQTSSGMYINENSPILSIIPQNSPLEIELLLPTRSAGFVQIGDIVQMRFDAFPYQKFGLVLGKIKNVDKALILPNDKVLPIKIDEAMYRVRASIEQQSVNAYGKNFPLKVGMIADADIILESRTLLEWLLEPIYALKGQLG
ncbi:HlyD family efflux transporter periplasmic adaptor subunit [Vibrio cholerae]|uniref:HlyD family secretion protein n=1 Tax=Vibrio cholerae TaxID=666 RepID=UPI001F8FDB76|nr:efflux RND transporter periplasmic adaptor subunit [Vibrio cholerae]EGR5448480.1 HlyD family efflux transporter periplasmic adaptor subunit [Vibrio cholerae]EGR5456489.1 HlyD family efflux transporter periplasmic adaptor subunit [Vibrio cholerae]EGR5464497.1 HlyD family efflux transporter periplasmic adaptor subunit [Vibrio cholerae]MEB5622288.1 HlyD family efflux transporter periplasmic adaptor subunit [Vibrio cholerae]